MPSMFLLSLSQLTKEHYPRFCLLGLQPLSLTTPLRCPTPTLQILQPPAQQYQHGPAPPPGNQDGTQLQLNFLAPWGFVSDPENILPSPDKLSQESGSLETQITKIGVRRGGVNGNWSY